MLETAHVRFMFRATKSDLRFADSGLDRSVELRSRFGIAAQMALRTFSIPEGEPPAEYLFRGRSNDRPPGIRDVPPFVMGDLDRGFVPTGETFGISMALINPRTTLRLAAMAWAKAADEGFGYKGRAAKLELACLHDPFSGRRMVRRTSKGWISRIWKQRELLVCRLADVESIAAEMPRRRAKLTFVSPLRIRTYRRHGRGDFRRATIYPTFEEVVVALSRRVRLLSSAWGDGSTPTWIEDAVRQADAVRCYRHLSWVKHARDKGSGRRKIPLSGYVGTYSLRGDALVGVLPLLVAGVMVGGVGAGLTSGNGRFALSRD